MEMQELPDDVQEALKAYRKEVEAAYESEFKLTDSKLEGARNATRDQLADLATIGVTTLSEIMQYGESEATRAKVAMYVCDKVIGKDAVLDPDDPMQKLVEKLSSDAASS